MNLKKLFPADLFRWLLLSLGMGMVGGVLGAAFHHTLHFVTSIRHNLPWLILLLPVGGLGIVFVYRFLGLTKNKGTNEIIQAVSQDKAVNAKVLPGIFLATAITHLFGGSAGREGAALQIGGSAASFLARPLGLARSNRSIFIRCGMSAVFAGLFATPLTACVFVLEFVSVGSLYAPALLPCLVSAYSAFRVSALLGVHPEGVLLEQTMSMNPGSLLGLVILAAAVSLLGILMCRIFHSTEHLAARYLPDPRIRICVGGGLLAALTLLVGDQRFSGAGMELALEAVGGSAQWYAFFAKMMFTAITIAAGFKGGEIVPTFCIGATFGCILAPLLGLDAGMGGALGLIGLFCAVTNAPLASMILSIELFGGANFHAFAVVCGLCFAMSGTCSLYSAQTQLQPHIPEAV